MLCTELRESVNITNFSSLFLLAHLSSSDEKTVQLPSSLKVYVPSRSGTTNVHLTVLFSGSLLPSVNVCIAPLYLMSIYIEINTIFERKIVKCFLLIRFNL